jgi:UDP-N-acetyl-D-mannosaminuronate dehydrogenase
MFDTIMSARESQAYNLAEYLVNAYKQNVMEGPIVIHGKAYKPDVEYCIGSYSTLVGHYIKEQGHKVVYVDPLADDKTECVDDIEDKAVILMAHNRQITYGYTGEQEKQNFYYDIKPGSVIVDPWRQLESTDTYEVLHYGNTR